MSHVNVIIAAAGKSVRYGKEDKLLEPCRSTCVIAETIKPFLSFDEIEKIIVAVDPDSLDTFSEALKKAGLNDNRIFIVKGSNTRTRTVKLAMSYLDVVCDLVLIHDGARPHVTTTLIKQVLDSSVQYGACVPAISFVDNLLLVDENNNPTPLDRSYYRKVQTPMGVLRTRAEQAYSQASEEYLDDFTVIHNFAPGPIKVIEGDANNIKVTTKGDLATLLVGFGYDIHRLKEGNGIKLLGEPIACPFSFIAHSDGDVAIHALMDAILSAIGEKDIGHLYPVNDSQYNGADSLDLLKGVLRIVKNKNKRVVNCTITIIAERPMISPFIDSMRMRLAQLLEVPFERFAINATTNEKVGDIGAGNAIAACAEVLLQEVS